MNVEEYYRETDPEKRKALLDKMIAEDNSEENQKRLELFDARYFYPKGQGRKKHLADSYMGVLMDMKVTADNNKMVVGSRSLKRLVQKFYKTLQIQKFSEEGDLSRQLLYMEFYHMMSIYLESSLVDKHYGSTLMHLVKISEENVQKKLIKDFYEIAWLLPHLTDMTEEFSLWTQAAYDAFCEVLPDCREKLTDYISKRV